MHPEMDTRSLLVRLVTCKFFVVAFPTGSPWVPPFLFVVHVLIFFFLICVNRIMERLNASVLQDLRVMVSKVVKVRDRHIG
jgi:hypothetical protein